METKTGMLAGLALLVVGSSAQAALLGRVPLTPGGTDYQAYYDTDLDITWVADANLAKRNAFGLYGIVNGQMSWYRANKWIGAMNAANFLEAHDWRLPSIVDTATRGCDWAFSGTDCGYNVQTQSGSTVYSEMAHLYYVTLGNLGWYDSSGAHQSGWGPTNTGPFSNILHLLYYSGTTYSATWAWGFDFGYGSQHDEWKGSLYSVWPVRDGDIALVSAVPVPAAGWLFASALGLIGMARRKAGDQLEAASAMVKTER